MASARDVADYFLMLAASDADDGEALTHLKLQKLLYYAQGFHIAIFGRPLFDEEIEAWTHGPVVNELWGVFKRYGDQAIPGPEEFDPADYFDDDQVGLLNDVWNAYGQFSAWKLRQMTHDEPPWRGAYRRGENNIISRNSLREYFVTQLTD